MKKLLLAFLLLLGTTANATNGPTISVGALRIYTNTSPACDAGQACLWQNGNILNFRKSTGVDFINLGGALQSATTVVDVSASVAPVASAALVGTNSTTALWRQLTADDILPGFTITSFNGAGSYTSVKELGDTIVNPNFTASYNNLPISANITDGINPTLVLVTPFTAGTEPFTYVQSTPNATVTWTLHATGAVVRTANVGTTWEARVYYGIATPGTINSAFVTGLPSSQLQTGATGLYAIGAGGGTKKAYLFFDASFTTPTIFKDNGTGFAVPTTCTASAVSVTNAFGVTRSYTECVSDNLLNAAFNELVQ